MKTVIKNFIPFNNNGFTLIELLLVIGITVIITSITVFNYASVYRERILNNTQDEISSFISLAQQKAISQENAADWGIRINNIDPNSPNIEMFYNNYSPSTIVDRYNLANVLYFQQPSSGNYLDIIFSKITGTPNISTEIIINLKGSTISKHLIINSQGGISWE